MAVFKPLTALLAPDRIIIVTQAYFLGRAAFLRVTILGRRL